MTNFDSTSIEALSALLDERRRYEGWLDQLETRRAESPSHVVDRVRSDYLSRLDGVTQQLRGRASELEATASSLRDRIAALQGEENTRRDERFELELRALVGEYEPERAQESMRGCDEAIERLGGERGGLEGELARISEVLALVAPPPPSEPEPEVVVNETAPEVESAEPESAGSTDPKATEEASEAAATGVAASALETSSLSSSDPSPMDELAFLHSVVDAPREDPVLPPADAASSVRSDAGADLLPPPLLTAPRRPVTPLSTSIPTTRDPFASTAKASTLTPGSMPSFLKDMPTEQVKTLKCQECGTMNYPTEWYCERCGGELAAM
jgi:hypothetical protein